MFDSGKSSDLQHRGRRIVADVQPKPTRQPVLRALVIYSTGGGGSSRTYNPNQLGNRFCALWPRRDGNPFRQVVLPARRDARAAVSASVLAGGLMARRQDRQPRSWINRVDEAAAETKGVGIACRGAASGGGSGWCGAGPAVVRGQSVENALGNRA